MSGKNIKPKQTHAMHERFIKGNNSPLIESKEDILRSKKGGNILVAFLLISVVVLIALAFTC